VEPMAVATVIIGRCVAVSRPVRSLTLLSNQL